ncbi:hypothetical protein EII17_02605 [Clostridiales bacterium COT073_COT-073]|nr:hypothetical protein EII17_02605 [Clostridiales bacterium COT073_COT-073]
MSNSTNLNNQSKNLARHSLAFRISSVTGGILFLIFSILTIYISTSSYHVLLDKQLKFDQADSTVQAELFRQLIDDVYQTANQAMVSIDEQLSAPKAARGLRQLARIHGAILKSNDNIYSSTICFEPDAYDGKDALSRNFQHRDEDGRIVVYGHQYNGKLEYEALDKSAYADPNSPTSEWYFKTKELNAPYLTDPYEFDGHKLITLNLPIQENGQFIGTLAVDISFDKVRQRLLEASSENYFYSLVDSQKIFIIHGLNSDYSGLPVQQIIPNADHLFEATSDQIEYQDYKLTLNNGRYIALAIPIHFHHFDNIWYLMSEVKADYFLKDIKKLTFGTIMFSILAMTAALASIVISVHKMVRKPLINIQSVLNSVAEYDFRDDMVQAKIAPNLKRLDVIGNISRSIDVMVENFKHLARNMTRNSERAVDTSNELAQTAQGSLKAANEIANAINNISESALHQAENTQSASDNIEDIRHTLIDNLNILENLVTQTRRIEKMKLEGYESLSELEVLTNRSSEGATEVNQVIMATNQSAQQIEKASGMIQSIADQTNLLALNAAIEAARAGEAGMGFAVVAEEIRKLAEQSTGFAKEIKQVISGLQDKSSQSVNIMASIQELVSTQDKSINRTKSRFDNIAVALDETNQIVEQLKQTTDTINHKNEKMVALLQNLSAIAEENASIAEEVNASSQVQLEEAARVSHAGEAMTKVADSLQREVNRFKI